VENAVKRGWVSEEVARSLLAEKAAITRLIEQTIASVS
jgi:hypothetical protein